MMLTYDFVALVGLYTAAAAVMDIIKHRIPNYLTVPAATLGLLYHTLYHNAQGFGFYPEGILFSLGGFAVGFSLLILPWILGGGGMGDVKLLAALGAWLGIKLMLIAFAVSALIAAMMALTVLIYSAFSKGVTATKNKYMASMCSTGKNGRKSKRKLRRVLPFAVPVALSTWTLILYKLLY